MQNIELKDFQIKCVNELFNITTNGSKKEVLVQAPTGSGKTIILMEYIKQYIEKERNTIFIWLTPGKGDLEEQSRQKMQRYFPQLKSKDIRQVLTQGFLAGDTAFINWEIITKKCNTAIREAESKNLYERIDEAYDNNLHFIVIIDEEHINQTIKAESIIDYLSPDYVIRVSATTKKRKEAEFIQIDELDVIHEGLITKALYINESVGNNLSLENENTYLLNLALQKQAEIKQEYHKNKINVNPLIIVQVPNNSYELIRQIEEILENQGYTYENRTVAKWLSYRKVNIEDISHNDAEPIVLIMKQAISTGWDCPRAKILLKLRDHMKEDFETQTIGRIRRMPQAHHYDNQLLDNCYLYTFDRRYEETVKQELGAYAQPVKLVSLKGEFRKFELIKQTKDCGFDGLDNREAFKTIRYYFVNKYKMGPDDIRNQEILQEEGYIFSDTIENYVVQDKIVKLDSDEIIKANQIKIKSTIDIKKSMIDLKHAIGAISTKIGIKYDTTKIVLERMFLKRRQFSKKFINLSLIEFYAFVINNENKLKYDFLEAVSQQTKQPGIQSEAIKETIFRIPETGLIKCHLEKEDIKIYEKNVYKDYPSNTIKSKSERMFEEYCETSHKIKWFYKNGENSIEYFSIIYVDAVGKLWTFYPDYILQDTEDYIWIIEAKGGENKRGESKNIDMKAEHKFEVLKNYAQKYDLKWGFVRDYDKEDSLYLCNTIYTEKMGTDNWVKIEGIL